MKHLLKLGGLGTYLSANDLQTARGEPVQDTARCAGGPRRRNL